MLAEELVLREATRELKVGQPATENAMEKWIEFYAPFFGSKDAAAKFVAACEAGAVASETAMLLMHQTQRLVLLADDIVKVRPRDSLRILFLMVCAEAVAKLHDGYKAEGKSRAYTQNFFDEFVSPEDRKRIEAGFVDDKHLSLEAVVDHLYDIRCDVVHEGRYWGFFFSSDGWSTVTAGSNVAVRMRYPEFRDIVVPEPLPRSNRGYRRSNGRDCGLTN